ncbi:tail fiber protein [Yersinia rohdei]|uniref:Tail fiber protein n=1 Tax=Yersinia rohdei TaxID=29485 RepID=A0A0U1HQP8_YERRO|nr:hypothetical protein [Yersinia rohdei]CQI88890.1 tail fiber protein [Yersinia rohdei]
MNRTDDPKKQPIPFGVNGPREDIGPTTPTGDNSASYNSGFPPITMLLKAAGGLPPKGQDMNQILYELSSLSRWNSAGALNVYDSTFGAAISGYPKGAVLSNSTFTGCWLNTTDANTANPENTNASLTGWVPAFTYGTTDVTGLAAANVTLTALQAANERITLAGVLTANINLIFPAWSKSWTIVNNCTGNFTVTCKTAAGTGVAVPIGTTAVVFSDGTNITLNGPLMVQDATNSNHAVNLGQGNAQWSPVVGASRNARMSVTAASSTATFTADQLTVTTALNGQTYLLTNFNKTINLGTTGAGGMDTGTVPVAGFVALYAIYNPSNQASAMLAVNTTSVLAPEVCAGIMPSGYTASALVSVWRTASSQLFIGYQQGRKIVTQSSVATSSNTLPASYFALGLTAIVPINAKFVSGWIGITTTAAANNQLFLSSSASGIYEHLIQAAPAVTLNTPIPEMSIITPQTIYYKATSNGSVSLFVININGYSF